MDITCTLFAAQSMDLNLRSGAEAILKQFQEQNLSNFLLSLSAELSSDAKPPASRVLAGIILKNSLDSKDSEKKELLIQQWVNLDASVKVKIKKSLLTTLGSLVAVARHVTSQVIAKVASIEIPRGECPDLIGILLHNLTEQAASAPLKHATLEVFGYVFQDIHPQNLDQDQANVLLTAVVQVASEAHLSSEVRLTAVKVLYGALDFADGSFAEDGERSYVMNSIIGTAVSEDKDIRAASFECLVAIASKYYMHLEPYILDILRLTAEAMKDDKSVALQAIEFWCNICICEEQLEVQETYAEFDDANSVVNCHDDANSVVNCHFIELTFHELVPMLLGTLLKQEEDKEQEGSVRKVSTSGMVCLRLIARTLGDVVLPHVMEFIDVNIVGPEWYCRRAATFALVSILVGPSVEKLVPLVLGKLDCLLNRMKDADREEKATIARTLGQVFEILHSPASANTIITDQNCHHIMNVLLESSKDDPEVSEEVFGAIYFLAKGYQDAELLPSELTPYIEQAIKALVSALDRAGKTNFSLRASAYRALNEIVRVSKIHENSDSIGQLLYCIMERLNGTFDFPIQSADDVRNQNDLQASLCILLQVIIHKLSNLVDNSIIPVAADNLMLLFFRVFNHRTCGSTVHDKAMLATGALAYAIGQDFEKHMPKLLLNYNEYQLTPVSLGVLGNICHVLEHQMLMSSVKVMDVLKKALSNPMLDRSVKPAIFSCFGDLALAIGEHLEEYLPTVMEMLQEDADLGIDKEDVDYRNQLRWAICRACSGILNGFKGPKARLIEPYLSCMFSFFQNVCDDKISDKRVARAAVAVLHDLQATIALRTQGMIDQLGGSDF